MSSTGLSHYEIHGNEPVSVTVKSFMELTGLGLTKTYELIGDGTLETVNVGRRRLILWRSVKRLILPAAAAPRRRGRPRKAVAQS